MKRKNLSQLIKKILIVNVIVLCFQIFYADKIVYENLQLILPIVSLVSLISIIIIHYAKTMDKETQRNTILIIATFLLFVFNCYALKSQIKEPENNCLNNQNIEVVLNEFISKNSLTQYPGLFDLDGHIHLNTKKKLFEKERNLLMKHLDNNLSKFSDDACKQYLEGYLEEYEKDFDSMMPPLLDEYKFCNKLSNDINSYLKNESDELLDSIFEEYNIPIAGIDFIYFDNYELSTPYSGSSSFYNFLKNNLINQIKSVRIIKTIKNPNSNILEEIILITK